MLQGQRVALTGKFAQKRIELEMGLVALGATVTGGVSGKTNLLIAGADGGSKLDKARGLGLPVLDEAQLAGLAEEDLGARPGSSYGDRFGALVDQLADDDRVEIRNQDLCDTSVRDSWFELAVGRCMGLPEDILGMFSEVDRFRLSWRMPSKKLHAGKGIWLGGFRRVLRPVVDRVRRVKDFETALGEWQSKSVARLDFEGHMKLVFREGRYAGMEFAYYPGGKFEAYYAMPFGTVSDYVDALVNARGLPNWPMLLTDHEEAKASPFFSKGAKAFDDFDPMAFQARWGSATLSGN